MSKNYYRDALEALGLTGSRSKVRNAFNTLATQPDDRELRFLAAEIIRALDQKPLTITKHTAVIRMTGIPAAKQLQVYCQDRAYE